jgi:hypothetical protein
VMRQEDPLRELLAATGWKVERLDRGETKIGFWFHVLASRA